MYEIEDFIPKQYQDLIEEYALQAHMKWNFNIGITSDNPYSNDQNIGFSCKFEPLTPHWNFFSTLVYLSADKIKIDVKSLDRLQVNLLPNVNSQQKNLPHVDNKNPHMVMLYYINDSDGDTLFYENNEISNSITPKKGKAVIFDGSTWHASSYPKKNPYRLLVNANFNLQSANIGAYR